MFKLESLQNLGLPNIPLEWFMPTLRANRNCFMPIMRKLNHKEWG